MKTKKLISLILTLTLICACFSFGTVAADEEALPTTSQLTELQAQFQKGAGPETEGYSIDYRYFSPVGENDTGKYPLVVWLHGMWEGSYEGQQIKGNNIAFWTSDAFQSRFAGGGAFIMVPRSIEEKLLYWEDSLIYPLRAAIDDFIAANKENIDLSRIYVGGFSMGGKMTLKMITAYPEMFAAAFPICPAWTPDAETAKLISDIPVWLTSAENDPLVNYNSVVRGWSNITENSNVKNICRFSTLSKSVYPDGEATSSGHHSWFAVNYDMFAYDCSDYPNMTTVNGNGEAVSFKYPHGMISWLSQFTSDFDGSAAADSGNITIEPQEENKIEDFFKSLLGNIFSVIMRIVDWFKALFK